MKNSRLLLTGLVLAAAILATPRPSGAQHEYAVTAAVGPVLPLTALGDVAQTGVSAKVGVWARPARLPFGVAVDALFARFGHVPGTPSQEPRDLRAIMISATTGRREALRNRVATYLAAGVGYYNHRDLGGTFDGSSGLGFNFGIGESLRLGPYNGFVELRYHTVLSNTTGREGRLEFIPITFGVRF